MIASEIIRTAIKNCGANGDLYYLYAQFKKNMDDIVSYRNGLTKALENNATLSIAPKIVKAELDNA